MIYDDGAEAHQSSLRSQLAQALLEPERRLPTILTMMWVATDARNGNELREHMANRVCRAGIDISGTSLNLELV